MTKRAQPRKRHARLRNLATGPLRPSATHFRILHAALDLLPAAGWPSKSAIARVLNVTPQAVSEHFRNPRFDAWFNGELRKVRESARDKVEAKLVTLAMAGDKEAYKLLWPPLPMRVNVDGSVELPHDGPATVVINSLIPRPPAQPGA